MTALFDKIGLLCHKLHNDMVFELIDNSIKEFEKNIQSKSDVLFNESPFITPSYLI